MENQTEIVEALRAKLRSDGFCLLRKAIPENLLEELQTQVTALYNSFLNGHVENLCRDRETATIMPLLWSKSLTAPRNEQTFKRWNVIEDIPTVARLLDHESVFPLVLAALGTNIHVLRSQLIIVPPNVREDPYLHTDSGELGKYRSADVDRPLMLSIQYFLSDIPMHNMGNFTLVPKSHVIPFPLEEGNPLGSQTSGFTQGKNITGRVQICASAGDAVFFHHSLWHGASENRSSEWRKSIILGYGPTFTKPYDYEKQSICTLERCKTQRQRRLLGDLGGWWWRPGCHHHPPPDQESLMRGQDKYPDA